MYNTKVYIDLVTEVKELVLIVQNVQVFGEQLVHRIGGSEVSNLVPKKAELLLDPPGISVFIGGTPEESSQAIRQVFGPSSSLGK